MKKTSIIKIVCVLVLLLGVHQCTSYKELAPHIFLVKENTSFLNQTLTMGQPLVVEGQRGSQYYGYIYVNGEKKEGYISSRNVIAYVFDESFEKVITFAKSINMITLPLYKEKSGYLLNSMLIPFLFSALDLLAKEISDVESIDLAWKKGTGSPKGPFEILDIIGLKTAYEIVSMYLKVPSFLAPYNFKAIAKLLQKYIDEGKLGKSTKEGFYKYD